MIGTSIVAEKYASECYILHYLPYFLTCLFVTIPRDPLKYNSRCRKSLSEVAVGGRRQRLEHSSRKALVHNFSWFTALPIREKPIEMLQFIANVPTCQIEYIPQAQTSRPQNGRS